VYLLQIHFSPSSLLEKQLVIFQIVFQHFVNGGNDDYLKIIIPGTTGTRNSSLIGYISHALSSSKISGKSPLLIFSPTGIVSFNLHGKTLYLSLKIHIKHINPFCG